MGLIQLYTWMTWIAHSMTGDLSSSGSFDPSCIVFDSSYVSRTWDWFESILIVMDRELWYDLTLGHSHLREFFYRMTIMSRHTLLSRWRIFEPCSFLRGYQMSFFTLEHETWLTHFIWSTLHRGIPLSVDDGFLWHSCSSEAIRFISHWSMGYDWVLWCDHRSIALSSLLTYFLRWLDQDTGTYESMQRSLVISGFALYWGITLSLAFGLRDTSSHWDMLFL